MAQKYATRAEDYSKWYNELVGRADLAEHSGVKGCMVIKPYGFAIWEKMRDVLDAKFKETGHSNAYFPIFIPKSLFEADFRRGDWLVFGKETSGLTDEQLKDHDAQTYFIPMDGPTRSLNLSNAVAITVFELLRQVTQQKNTK